MGSDHEGDQHFGLIQGGDHERRVIHDNGHHCWCRRVYGRASQALLLQLLMASASASTPLTITVDQVLALSLEPLAALRQQGAAALVQKDADLELRFDWPRPEEDPRELSEIAELRLWSLRADAACPWLPLVLERSSGQLARHVAMLLPHQFHRSEGLRFAPESLELWITHRLFVLDAWARAEGLNCRQNLGQMAAVLGFELDPGFWDQLS